MTRQFPGLPNDLHAGVFPSGGRSPAYDTIEWSRRAARRTNDTLRAFTLVNDAEFRSNPSLLLDGLAIGVKDLYDTAGLATAYGSPIYRDHVPAKDAALVARLKALGAFVLGKTVTTEFAWRQAGPTVNPYNPEHTPGGSSSGSAAAVAAGIVPLALGTQTFGSIIRPAAFCGVFGFKPGYGALPLDGVQPLSPSLDHAGYLARSVETVRRLHGLVLDESRTVARPANLRLRLVRSRYWRQASDTQRIAFESAVEALRKAGADMHEEELPPSFDGGFGFAETILRRESATTYRPLIDRWPAEVSIHIRELTEKGEELSVEDYTAALAARDELKDRLRREMKGFDAILTLSALGEAPLLGEGTGNPGPCVLWTLLGVPTASLPCGFGRHGLPLAIQLVGAAGHDFELLDLCAFAEKVLRAGLDSSGSRSAQ